MRVGVLTGGGDCPGLNAVIRAVVRKGLNAYGHEFLGFRYGWAGVMSGDVVQLTHETTRGILHRGGTILGTSRTNPYKEDGGFERVQASLEQHRLDGLIPIGGITSWLPLFLFVVLFGLSMDYHVFILSRIREAVDRGMRTEDAVSHGIKSTAGVVTSAAVVMIAVFAIFATLSALDFKMMGVGLAVAVLIDATLVRAVLLPATMKLLGRWNWYLPQRLKWLPRISHDGVAPESARA